MIESQPVADPVPGYRSLPPPDFTPSVVAPVLRADFDNSGHDDLAFFDPADGKDDIAQFHSSGRSMWVSKSTGSRFST